jgi:hypothetical protein
MGATWHMTHVPPGCLGKLTTEAMPAHNCTEGFAQCTSTYTHQ